MRRQENNSPSGFWEIERFVMTGHLNGCHEQEYIGTIIFVSMEAVGNWKSESFCFFPAREKANWKSEPFAFSRPGKKQIGSLNHFAFCRPGKKQIGSLIHFQLLFPDPWKILCRGKLRKYGERFALWTRKTTGPNPTPLHSSCWKHALDTPAADALIACPQVQVCEVRVCEVRWLVLQL